jgi:hypothetical protein
MKLRQARRAGLQTVAPGNAHFNGVPGFHDHDMGTNRLALVANEARVKSEQPRLALAKQST